MGFHEIYYLYGYFLKIAVFGLKNSLLCNILVIAIRSRRESDQYYILLKTRDRDLHEYISFLKNLDGCAEIWSVEAATHRVSSKL